MRPIMRVLVTDFQAKSDFEREVLPEVEMDTLLSIVGHPPAPDDLLRVIKAAEEADRLRGEPPHNPVS